LITADEPSTERMKPVIAIPRLANVAAPSASASTIDTKLCGHGVDFSTFPSTNSAAAWSANTIMIEARTARRYTIGGRGVERMRLRIPISRRATRISARPANAVVAAP
jgi:hypothetical protein